ncbi:MAG: hypothetical protein ACK5QC_15225 [Bacteroidota bacterium]|jgi:hypothetical protein|nr:hypothetical protein [Bacteroidota bacterium]
MATPKTLITFNELENLANQYVNECINNKKEHPTASGKVVLINDRKIPTIDYFLRIWIPLQGKPTISRATYYRWLNDENNLNKCDTIKTIEGLFKALAADIVANEQKGIFYAKNKLGWTDKHQTDLINREVPLFPNIPLPDIGNR